MLVLFRVKPSDNLFAPRNESSTMTRTQATLAAFGTLLTFSLPAVAQDAPPTPLTQGDQQFMIQAAQGNVSDYANGEAAVNRAQSPAVRQLGIWLMEDHNRLNIQMYALAGVHGLNLPLTASAKDQAELNTLLSKQGADFDRTWLQDAIRTNQQDISDARREEAATTDPEVRPLVKGYEAAEYAHLIAAQTIQSSLK